MERSMVHIDYGLADSEADSGSFTWWLGGIKQLKDLFAGIDWNATTLIFNCKAKMPETQVGRELDDPLGRGGISGIDQEVKNYLMELTLIDHEVYRWDALVRCFERNWSHFEGHSGKRNSFIKERFTRYRLNSQITGAAKICQLSDDVLNPGKSRFQYTDIVL